MYMGIPLLFWLTWYVIEDGKHIGMDNARAKMCLTNVYQKVFVCHMTYKH